MILNVIKKGFNFSQDGPGNHVKAADLEAAEVASRISDRIASLTNYLGNPFRPDWATPSTHLLYGYWVGATPDGRKAREICLITALIRCTAKRRAVSGYVYSPLCGCLSKNSAAAMLHTSDSTRSISRKKASMQRA